MSTEPPQWTTEKGITEYMRDYISQYFLLSPCTLERIEVIASHRPEVIKTIFSEFETVGSFKYFNNRIHPRLFADVARGITYFCVHFTERSADLEDPRYVSNGAILLAKDVALGYHSIYVSKSLALTRSFTAMFEEKIKVNSMVVFRTWNSRMDGRKLFVEGDAVRLSNDGNRLERVGRADALFYVVPVESLGSMFNKEMSAEDYQHLATTSTEEWEKTALINRPFKLDSSFPEMEIPKNIGMEIPLKIASQRPPGNHPFDFQDPCTLKMRVFRRDTVISAVCAFSHNSTGPRTAHGGSVMTCFDQFLRTSIENLYGGLTLSSLTISFDKPTPILSLAYFQDLRIKELGNGSLVAFVNLTEDYNENGSTKDTTIFCRGQATFTGLPVNSNKL